MRREKNYDSHKRKSEELRLRFFSDVECVLVLFLREAFRKLYRLSKLIFIYENTLCNEHVGKAPQPTERKT